jgi:hypothetical protein
MCWNAFKSILQEMWSFQFGVDITREVTRQCDDGNQKHCLRASLHAILTQGTLLKQRKPPPIRFDGRVSRHHLDYFVKIVLYSGACKLLTPLNELLFPA